MTDPVLDIFREEAREHLHGLEQGFLDLEAAEETRARPALIDNLFRHAHSLKGDARAIGLPNLQQAAQILEDVLDELREKPETVDHGIINHGLAQLDKVRSAFDAWQNGDAAGPYEGNGAVAAVPPVAAVPSVAARPPAESGPVSAQAEARSEEPWETVPDPNVSHTEESFTVRVPSERLDRMLSLAGEIRIAQRAGGLIAERFADLQDNLERLLKLSDGRRAGAVARDDQHGMERRQYLETAIDQVRGLETEFRNARNREQLLVEGLETDIRQARLLPLIMLADSLRRVIRDLAQSLGKAIRYEIEVGQILLDKAVIEAMREPLLHLVRNACDHGIESPEERISAGKPPEGLIRVQATRRGELVRIHFSDDGRGVNFDQVRDRLRKDGELTDGEIAELSRPDLARYLFKPGFSTAPTGSVSGRGVGLDVVFDTVRKLQGNVKLDSSSAVGTIFSVTVPVTVSTVRIVTVLSNGQFYGVPSLSIVRTGRAKPEDLRELEGSLILPVDGQPVRWVQLADLLNLPLSRLVNNDSGWSYLLVSHEGHCVAVAVDDLEEESEVLLKPLGFPLGGMPGIVGGTIRRDGSVQIVLDLTSAAFGRSAARAQPVARRPQAARILIVDDSPTTRAILRNVFTAAGYSVRTASDGLDALERLRSGATDLVVSDVEMPRLNGFDLTRQIKAKFGLPVILVTGREKEEHRREGLEAGADAYVVKSTFQGKGLLEIVEQLV